MTLGKDVLLNKYEGNDFTLQELSFFSNVGLNSQSMSYDIYYI